MVNFRHLIFTFLYVVLQRDAYSFALHSTISAVRNICNLRTATKSTLFMSNSNAFLDNFNPTFHKLALNSAFVSAITVSFSESSQASNGEFGLLEGKWLGMLHPVSFLVLYAIAIYTAVEGFNWRKSRTILESIKSLQTNGETNNGVEIENLKNERQQLLKGDPKNKHVAYGSILLGSGVALALEGGLSTYWRIGELFPDSHLFSGLGIVAIWAISYSLSPLMAKGNNTARNLHATLNVIGLALFTSQITSGWEIMTNVWNKTPGW